MKIKMALLSLCVLGLYNCYGSQWSGIRDGVIYLRAPQATKITVRWQGVWEANGHEETIYMQSGDGRLIARRNISTGEVNGKAVFEIPERGDARLEIPGMSFRSYFIEIPPGIYSVYEPVKLHFSTITPKGLRLFFNVNENKSFTVCGKNYGGPDKIRITSPPGAIFELALKKRADRYYDQYDSINFNNPEKGIWKLELLGEGKISFWLCGTANYFSLDSSEFFIPELKPGIANITVTPEVLGRSPLLGALLPERVLPQFAYDTLRKLGIKAGMYYLNRMRLEEKKSNLPATWLEGYKRSLGIKAAFTIVESPGFAPKISNKRFGKTESAMYLKDIVCSNALYQPQDYRFFALYDEPNTVFTIKQFIELLDSIAPILKKNEKKSCGPLFIAGPETSGFLNGPTVEGSAQRMGAVWCREMIRRFGSVIGAVSWHEWNVRDLVATEWYRRTVEEAYKIAGPNRPLVISQTNISSGNHFSPYEQYTFYAAIWLASVVVQSSISGRLSMLNWFPAIDDAHHRKGLIEYDGGAQLKIRPVGIAMGFINAALKRNVLRTLNNSFEMEALATCDSVGGARSIILVNKYLRKQRATFDIAVGEKNEGQRYRILIGGLYASSDKVALLDTVITVTRKNIQFSHDFSYEGIFHVIAEKAESP